MKNLTKILGIVLAVVTVASMLVISAPAAAGTHTWTTVSTPSGVGYVVSDASVQINDVYHLVYNSDKSVIYAVADVNAVAGVITAAAYDGPAIFKSTNSGRTWQLVKTGFEATYPNVPWYGTKFITDIITSPVNVNELYFSDGTTIYTSKDAGTTWTKLSSVFTWAVSNAWVTVPAVGQNCIMTLELAQYGSVKLVFAGTATDNVGLYGDQNGVFVCEESAFGMPWTDLDVLNQRATPFTQVNVHDIKIDPTDFATKQGVIAVVTANDTETLITGKYLGNQWNQAAYFTDTEIGTDIADTYRATIALPSDFSSNAASGKFQAWVGIATLSAVDGDVFMWLGSGSTAIDLNVSGPATTTEVTSLASTGTIASPGLVAGGYTATTTPNVWYSASGYGFTKNVKAPTGSNSAITYGTAYTCVLPLSDFAASGKALVGTVGYGAAVSYTQDFCSTFNQISLMANSVTSLDDMGSSVTSVFIVTSSAASVQSVWKQVVIGTTIYWERIYSELPAHANTAATPPGTTDWDIEGTADGSVFLADIGDTGIWRSADDGQTWVKNLATPPANISAWMPLSASSILVGGLGKVYVTTTNGIVWFTYNCLTATHVITDFDAVGSTWLAAGIDDTNDKVNVAQSTNAGVTWTTLKVGAADATLVAADIGWADTVSVAAAYDFATTGNVFVTVDRVSSSNSGVWRYPAMSATGWTKVDGNSYDGNGNVARGYGIVAGQGGPGSSAEGAGMIYVTDGYTTGGGVSRIKGLSNQAENLAAPGSVTFDGLWLTTSGTDNVLWTLGSDELIYTYTDTTNKAGSGVAVTGSTYAGFVIYGVDLQLFPGGTGGWITAVKWNAMANATGYYIYVTSTANSATSLNMYAAAASGAFWTTATTATIGMAPNTTYYISVWASDVTPSFAYCSSFLFDKAPISYTTAPGVANWTPNLFPNDGASNVPVNANLAWDPVLGATGYELQIAKANAADPKVMPTGTATINLVGAGYAVSGLDYDTTYVWRVRAVSGTSKGEWVTSIFTTEKEELPVVTVEPAPTPTIIVTAPPQVTVTQAAPAVTPILTVPQATIVIQQPDVDESTPAYIWIIVAIGALLTIAVVVLIIRTRRVV